MDLENPKGQLNAKESIQFSFPHGRKWCNLHLQYKNHDTSSDL